MEFDPNALARRNHELSILNTIAEALSREVDLREALRATLGHAAALMGLRAGWIWLLDEATGASHLAAAQHLPPALTPERMEGSCYCLDAFRAGGLAGAANVNVIACSRLRGLLSGTDGLRYHASIPLSAQGRRLGVLNVASASWHELADDDLRLLYTIGDMLSIAIERARLFANSARLGALEERNRLAREIHDTLAQGLSAIALQLEAADALLEAGADPTRARRAVQRALALSRANLEDARRSVLDLRAAPLEGHTLAEALPALAHALAGPHGLAVDWLTTGDGAAQLAGLPRRVTDGLYRVAQEAVANAVHHARASRLSLHLDVGAERVALAVADDGQGFDPDRVPPGHFGLLGMRERVRLLGGAMRLCSAPGEGTRIEVEVPLSEG
jgi:two-component system NarL family sensor kinase